MVIFLQLFLPSGHLRAGQPATDWCREVSPRAIMAHTMRAILLARATAASLRDLRSSNFSNPAEAIPLALWTGRRGAFARPGLLRIPEELQPPAVLARATSLAREFAGAEPATLALPDRLLRDPALLSAHRDMLPPARTRWTDPVEVPLLTGCVKLAEAPDLAMAWGAMSRDERITCLADAEALDLIIVRAGEGRA